MGSLNSQSYSRSGADGCCGFFPPLALQFSYAIGKKLTISCTVFFAASFDNLRRKLGVDEAIIESLSHAAKWDAQGGKSKALFFRTADQRYIVKELVTKWNVSDVVSPAPCLSFSVRRWPLTVHLACRLHSKRCWRLLLRTWTT